ncbi:MAG: hypothetical protein U0893_16720 [Chloroflexota bacterium]
MAELPPREDESGIAKALPNVLLVEGDDAWGYTIRRPEVWHARPLDVDGGHGVVYTPDPDSLDTMISVEIRDLGTVVWQRDLRDIEAGFLNGLRAVPGSTIERHEAYANEFAIGVDAVQTFQDGDVVRKRWVRLLYKKSRQARVIAQGATVEEYDRLRPLFAPCLTTFRLHDGA